MEVLVKGYVSAQIQLNSETQKDMFVFMIEECGHMEITNDQRELLLRMKKGFSDVHALEEFIEENKDAEQIEILQEQKPVTVTLKTLKEVAIFISLVAMMRKCLLHNADRYSTNVHIMVNDLWDRF